MSTHNTGCTKGIVSSEAWQKLLLRNRIDDGLCLREYFLETSIIYILFDKWKVNFHQVSPPGVVNLLTYFGSDVLGVMSGGSLFKRHMQMLLEYCYT